MRILVDTNVLIDVLAGRAGLYDDSYQIWRLCEDQAAEGWVSAVSFTNIAYIMRKELNPELVSEIFRKLLLIFRCADLTEVEVAGAAEMKRKDYEDAVQICTAKSIGASYIVTRNTRDFQESDPPALDPGQFIRQIDRFLN